MYAVINEYTELYFEINCKKQILHCYAVFATKNNVTLVSVLLPSSRQPTRVIRTRHARRRKPQSGENRNETWRYEKTQYTRINSPISVNNISYPRALCILRYERKVQGDFFPNIRVEGCYRFRDRFLIALNLKRRSYYWTLN